VGRHWGQSLAQPVPANSLDTRGRWTGDEPFGAGSPVRLRIALRNARLYAVWCGGE